ncbi:hypothetical protein ACI3EJ_02240 [Ligilactobacillus acidipiscis]|uniref:hypothetical protein n=1 Tax=Ligilactobacillus acidipiscis TaxID=89059 RepID=UPI0038709EFB
MKLFHKNNGLKRTIVNLNKPSFNWDSDKIVVKTSTEENLLQLSRSNQDAYDVYIELLNHDYVLYMHQDQRSYFIKREEVWTIWQRKDLIQQGQTFYTLADPLKNNKLAKKRLVVIFLQCHQLKIISQIMWPDGCLSKTIPRCQNIYLKILLSLG